MPAPIIERLQQSAEKQSADQVEAANHRQQSEEFSEALNERAKTMHGFFGRILFEVYKLGLLTEDTVKHRWGIGTAGRNYSDYRPIHRASYRGYSAYYLQQTTPDLVVPEIAKGEGVDSIKVHSLRPFKNWIDSDGSACVSIPNPGVATFVVELKAGEQGTEATVLSDINYGNHLGYGFEKHRPWNTPEAERSKVLEDMDVLNRILGAVATEPIDIA